MGLASIGIPGLILIVVLALIIFGPKKLPEIGKAAGETLRGLKAQRMILWRIKQRTQNKKIKVNHKNKRQKHSGFGAYFV